MTLRQSVDRQVVAMCALAESVNDDMATTTVDERAVETIVACPVPLSQVPQHKLPLLSITRRSDSRVVEGNWTRIQATFELRYVLSATGLDEAEDRWPMLQDVWHRLTETILAGYHENIADGENVLIAADVTRVDQMSPAVQYQRAPEGDSVYPGFVGTVTLVHRSLAEISKLANRDALPDLVDLYAHYRIDPALPDDGDDVSEIITAE